MEDMMCKWVNLKKDAEKKRRCSRLNTRIEIKGKRAAREEKKQREERESQ